MASAWVATPAPEYVLSPPKIAVELVPATAYKLCTELL